MKGCVGKKEILIVIKKEIVEGKKESDLWTEHMTTTFMQLDQLNANSVHSLTFD